jgi:hypothetical protein
LDQTVSVYDMPSGTRLGDPIPSDAPYVAAVAVYNGHLRPDGHAVAITDRNGVAIWDLTPERLLDAACTLAGRNLSRSEWDTYLAGLGEYRPTCPDLS